MLACANCSESVIPTKKFSWFWFIVLLVVFMPLVQSLQHLRLQRSPVLAGEADMKDAEHALAVAAEPRR